MAIDDIKGCKWGNVINTDTVEAASERCVIRVADELCLGRQGGVRFPHKGAVEKSLFYPPLDGFECALDSSEGRLAMQHFCWYGGYLGWHNDKGYDGRHRIFTGLQSLVEGRQGLNEQIHALIRKFIAAGCEEIQGFLSIKSVKLAVEVAMEKVPYPQFHIMP